MLFAEGVVTAGIIAAGITAAAIGFRLQEAPADILFAAVVIAAVAL